MIKRISVLALLAVFPAADLYRHHSTVKAAPGCTVQSLSGPYTYALKGGYFDPKGNYYDFDAAGILLPDGAGGLSGKDTTSDGALITRGRQYSGSYTVNADCTGSLSLQTGGGTANLDFIITNNSRNVDFIQTDNYTDIAGTAQQQFPAQ